MREDYVTVFIINSIMLYFLEMLVSCLSPVLFGLLHQYMGTGGGENYNKS